MSRFGLILPLKTGWLSLPPESVVVDAPRKVTAETTNGVSFRVSTASPSIGYFEKSSKKKRPIANRNIQGQVPHPTAATAAAADLALNFSDLQ
jgi:hypothetical protein